MIEKSRTNYSILNIIGKGSNQLLVFILGFVSRKIFVLTLGIQYLGVLGLFSSILDMLSLSELGMSWAISFALYKPIAERNNEKIYAIMQFYKKAYHIVAISVFAIGVFLIPFLPQMVKGASEEILRYLTLIYLLYLINSASSYLFTYKTALLIAAQKEYKAVNYRSVIYIITTIIQIITLLVLRNFIIYLIINITSTFITNFLVSKKAENEFPVLRKNLTDRLEKYEIKSIFSNIGASFLSRLSSVIMTNSNNIIVSAFITIYLVGLRSNYLLLITQVSTLFTLVTSSLIPSLGNFAASETKERQFLMFKNIFFLSFWWYCFSVTGLFVLISPLISIWLGNEYLLSTAIVGAMLFDVFLVGMFWPTAVFRYANGIFKQGMYRPLITAIVNIVLALALVKHYGMLGVFLAAIISRLATEFWFDPWQMFKIVFPDKKLTEYFFPWIGKLFVLIICIFVCSLLYKILPVQSNFMKFLCGIAICIIVPNSFMYIIYHNTDEYKYFEGLVKSYTINFISNIKNNRTIRIDY